MSTSPTKRVLLFGLSANPPTGKYGHLGIVKHFSPKFDEVWVLPVYSHAYESKRKLLIPYNHRLKLCELNFASVPNAIIKQTEKNVFDKLKTPNDPFPAMDTFKVVSHLQETYPNVKFTWLLSGDTFSDLCAGKWTNGDSLRNIIDFVVINRPGVTMEAPSSSQTIHTVPNLRDISSTQARSHFLQSNAAAAISEILEQDVINYIKINGLYTTGPSIFYKSFEFEPHLSEGHIAKFFSQIQIPI